MTGSRLIACTTVGESRGADAAAAAVGVAAALRIEEPDGALVLDVRRAARVPRGTLLASSPARSLEASILQQEGLRAAARGRLCFAAADPPSMAPDERIEALAELLDPSPAPLVICICDPPEFRPVLAMAPEGARAALIKSLPGSERPLLALLTEELHAEGIPIKAWTSQIGVIPARRALAGLEPGGSSGRRGARLAAHLAPAATVPCRVRSLGDALRTERAQALPAVVGIALLIVAFALILLAIGGAATAKGRLQRSVDLAALSAARSMRDDFPRLFVPAMRVDGTPNPGHLERAEYLDRAETAGLVAAERNGADADHVEVRFPDGESMAPLRVRVDLRTEFVVAGGGAEGAGSTEAGAEAEVSPPTSAGAATTQPTIATGGGYTGPLVPRQGKPMRPDVAEAFDLMAASASADGISLLINSAFRSDAEQRELWEQNPDPRWVAPPGTSLHRCGTELDLGTADAYGWLAANASRFGFTQRYSWEAWHYGFDGGPAPCSAEGDRVTTAGKSDGRAGAAAEGLPSFVPPQFREPLLASAARHDVSAALLAAQLMAESNFNPNAVSPMGAQGIAQFMPATAAAYGLEDPFDPVASIDAQARLMGDLMAQFGSVELALAGYNAGPGAVASCSCVPPYPETQAYVARIMALLNGAGELSLQPPTLEVRLVA